LTFGGVSWQIQQSDFEAFRIGSGGNIGGGSGVRCVGAVFTVETNSDIGPQWIVGDAFLKNVYSVFRYEPPSIGFANLSAQAVRLANVDGDLPSATVGSTPVQTGDATTRYSGVMSGWMWLFLGAWFVMRRGWLI